MENKTMTKKDIILILVITPIVLACFFSCRACTNRFVQWNKVADRCQKEWKEGTVVQLKTGSPNMVAGAYDVDFYGKDICHIRTNWVNQEGDPRSEKYSEILLRKIK
jgi:uncharacterized protein YodC (DUF2158 family)